MNKVAQAVQSYLQSQEWHFSFNELKSVFDFKMGAKNCDSIHVIILARESSICTYAIMPMKVPEKCRAAATEYVARANYGLNIGNLEIDVTDGEIRFKSSIICDDDYVPPMGVIETGVDIAFIMMDKYSEGLLRVMYGGMSAEDAIELVEGD